jgi:glycosyltransferase involved in cell wall biosynthesis
MTPIGSVIIPAHNEAALIGACLDTLLGGFQPGELEVVAVCNGCTDGTAGAVRGSGYMVHVIELSSSSKPAALRAGEEIVKAFPRMYLDADVLLSSISARKVLECLRRGQALAARPPIRYDTAHSAPSIRSYYRARSEMPAVMRSLWGAGVYGLSEAGRARFGRYPDVVNEDLFVDQHFHSSEMQIVDCPPAVVRAPRSSIDLLRILRRVYWGNSENRHQGDSGPVPTPTAISAVRDLARLTTAGPAKAVDVLTYAAFAALARLTLAFTAPSHWERDNSSRIA